MKSFQEFTDKEQAAFAQVAAEKVGLSKGKMLRCLRLANPSIKISEDGQTFSFVGDPEVLKVILRAYA